MHARGRGLLLLLACGLACISAQTTIVSTVVARNQTTLEALIANADLTTTLSVTTREFTLFAPTDAAFNALGTNSLVAKLTASPVGQYLPLLQDVLKYHVLEQNAAVPSSALPFTALNMNTLSPGSSLSVGRSAPQVNALAPGVGAANITTFDLAADNGVVHIVNTVLLPPSTQRTVAGIATSSADHTTLANLLIAADLVTTLQSDAIDTTFTVFAPTNAAFEKLPAETLTCLALPGNKFLLTELLKFHVVSGYTVSSALTDGETFTSMATMFSNNQFTFMTAGSTLMTSSESNITAADLLATNGVVHVVNTVLIPAGFKCRNNIVDVIGNSPEHNSLEGLIGVAGLNDTLKGEGLFTLFAPADTAIAALPAATQTKLTSGGQWVPLLTQILLFHVLAKSDAPLLAADLPATATDFATRADGGDALTIKNSAAHVVGKWPSTGFGTIRVFDLIAGNGVVHAIDAVLLPVEATRTVVAIATGSSDHTMLVDLLTTTNLVGILGSNDADSAFTVFAPTNAAFQAVPQSRMSCLAMLGNRDLLRDLLYYHVAANVTLQADLPSDVVPSLATSFNSNSIPVSDISVTETDLLAINGVVHVVDTVLIPAGFECTNTIVEIVAKSAAHTSLETLIGVAGLNDTLRGEGLFTLFAPTDAAIAALPAELRTKITGGGQWVPLLAQILLFHVLASMDATMLSADLPGTATDVDTLNIAGGQLQVSSSAIAAKAPGSGSATITTADLKAGNGVVHVIDTVLLPVEATRTVVDIVTGSADHTTLVDLLNTVGLNGTLNATALTVFAPTNAAFQNLDDAPLTLECIGQEDKRGLLRELLKYHFAEGVTVEADLSSSAVPSLATSFDSNSIPAADISATTTELLAFNGVVHVLDAVLIPAGFACSNTIVDIVIQNPSLKSLAALVKVSNLISTLKGAGNITLFAPSDTAVAALLPSTQAKLLSGGQWVPLLTQILLFHVLPRSDARVMAADLPATATDFATRADGGDEITIKTEAPQVVGKAPGAGSATITAADLTMPNGVVHIIDTVLLPVEATRTVVDIATGSTDHTRFVELLTSAGLVDTLSAVTADSAFSVFAPTNAALQALPETTWECLAMPGNIRLLRELLHYHVTEGVILAADLPSDAVPSLATLFDSNSIPAADISVTTTDLLALNGVVHVVDAVLVPAGFECTNFVVQHVAKAPTLSTLGTLIDVAELNTTFRGEGLFTLFAPTDAALATLPAVTRTKLASGGQWVPLLTQILLFHVLAKSDAALMAADLPATATDFATRADGGAPLVIKNLPAHVVGKWPSSGFGSITTFDLIAGNGVVHVINTVLLPVEAARTVIDIADTSPDHGTLVDLLTLADLYDTLDANTVDSAFTVFAPTDEVFEGLPGSNLTCLMMLGNRFLLRDLLYFHVAPGVTLQKDFPSDAVPSIATIFDSNSIPVSDISATETDMLAVNGVVHVVDALLTPAGFECILFVIDIVAKSAAHTSLETLIGVADLTTVLQGAGLFTLFAPTDAAIAALPAELQTKLASGGQWVPLLTQILLFHVLASMDATILVGGLPATVTDVDTLNVGGAQLQVSSSAIAAKAPGSGSATITTADLRAGNGVVHVIDTVLLPPEATRTVVGYAAGRTEHTILVELLTTADLVSTLENVTVNAAFTVFAPEDVAFQNLGELPLTLACIRQQDKTGLLRELLKYHVAKGVTLEANLPSSAVPSLASSFDSDSIPVDEISATATDLLAVNGVVHVLDTVLIPGGFACTNTILDIVITHPSLNLLETLVDVSGITMTLRGASNITLFAPSDTAVAALLPSTQAKLLSGGQWVPLLTQILLFHVLPRSDARVMAADLPATATDFATRADGGDEITIKTEAPQVVGKAPGAGSATITAADLTMPNGVVHIIDTVLLPVEATRTVLDVAESSTDHTMLVELFELTGLNDALSDVTPNAAYTMFAPTNAVFEALPETTWICLTVVPNNLDLLRELLWYHVGDSVILAADLPSDGVPSFAATFTSNSIPVADISATETDVLALNGVVHSVDALLVPLGFSCRLTVVEIVIISPDHNGLEGLIDVSGLADTLRGDRNFTLFAPTDTALSALPTVLRSKLVSGGMWVPLLQEILKFHVLAKGDVPVMAADLPATATDMDTLNIAGGQLQVSSSAIAAKAPGSGSATITTADLKADNGVVHAISTVLLPVEATRTVMDIASGSPDHTRFVELLTATGLFNTLSAADDDTTAFTVFAPTNAAFQKFDGAVMECLGRVANQGRLTELLMFHVVTNYRVTNTIRDRQTLTSMATMFTNNRYTFMTAGPRLMAANASNITAADLLANNGVVHVVDNLLIPEGFYCPNNIHDVVANEPTLKSLETLVGVSGLAATLRAPDNFTLFAPSDTAVAALPAVVQAKLLSGGQWVPLLTQILLFHVLAKNDAAVMAADLPADATDLSTRGGGGDELTKYAKRVEGGDELTVKNEAPQVIGKAPGAGEATITKADLITPNGVVHIIDTVLLPVEATRTVVGVATASPAHSILVELLQVSGLVDALTNLTLADTAFTVFAPTDTAWQEFDVGSTLDCLKKQKRRVLLQEMLWYHIAAGVNLHADLPSDVVPSLSTSFSSNSIPFANISVTATDLLALNGVVHSVDTVLAPPEFSCYNSVVDIVVRSRSHTTLEALVGVSGLSDAFRGAPQLTLFAPTDTAIASLPAAMQTKLASGGQWVPLLQEVLKFHVLDTVLAAGSLNASATDMPTLNAYGAHLEVSSLAIVAKAPAAGRATITATNGVSDNGVVYAVDTVLLPPEAVRTVVGIATGSEDHTMLVDLLTTAGLISVLNNITAAAAFTVFAPTDAAIQLLDAETVQCLSEEANRDLLRQLLLYHVVPGVILHWDFPELLKPLSTLFDSNSITVAEIEATWVNLIASNGVVHPVDEVLIPDGFACPFPVPTAPDVQIVDNSASAFSASSLLVAILLAAAAAVQARA